MGLFKIYQYSGTVITDTNALFVSYLVGNDTTGTGTRANPYATITKAYSVSSGKTYIVYNSDIYESTFYIAGKALISDSPGARILNSNTSFLAMFYNDVQNSLLANCNLTYCIWTGNGTFGNIINCTAGVMHINNCIRITASACTTFNHLITTLSSDQLTIYDYRNYTKSGTTSSILQNSIIINSIDLYNYTSRATTAYYPTFKYCLFRKLTAWKWNGNTITINWTTNPNTSVAYTTETLLERVYQSLLYYANSLTAGTDKTYFLAILASNTTMFYADTNGQTNKVVDDVAYPIFNLYNGTTPVDYSLKLDATNVALTMSDTGSYVGAYKANLGGVMFGSIVNVNTDGTDDAVTTPTLLVSDGYNQFSANDASTQSRNRIRTIVQSYPRGKAMAGAGSQLTSCLASRIYFGKKRPMVTSGSGLTIPVETFEVIPYDSVPSDNSVGAANDITGKSTFPRFSVAFNGSTQMWYKANGTPLLFNDLATYSIITDVSLTEYGTWAVTSADAEDYNLSLIATANSLTKKNIPVVYCKQELNLNYV